MGGDWARTRERARGGVEEAAAWGRCGGHGGFSSRRPEVGGGANRRGRRSHLSAGDRERRPREEREMDGPKSKEERWAARERKEEGGRGGRAKGGEEAFGPKCRRRF